MVKNVFFALLLILSWNCVKSQDTISSKWNMIWTTASPPYFDDDKSYDKLLSFVSSQLKYTDTITQSKIVYIAFGIDTLGFTYNHVILKPTTDSLLDEEALRVCRLIKFKYPAMQKDKPVSIEFVLPVKFEPKQVIKPKHCFFKRYYKEYTNTTFKDKKR